MRNKTLDDKVVYKTEKAYCCEAKMYQDITGQWSAVFKRCKECRDDPTD